MSETRAPRPGEAEDQITLEVRPEGAGRVVVTVGGEVDILTSPQLRAAVLDQIEQGAELVVLDLDGITFLGTSGLAVLIEAREAAQAGGVALRLACSERRVLRPLTIAGLTPLFDVHETVGGALAEQ